MKVPPEETIDSLNKIQGLNMYEKKIETQEKRIYDLKNLIGLGISLASNLNFESLVESILYSCIGQMLIEKVAIMLQVDIDENNLYIHMAKGYDHSFEEQGTILNENSPILRYLEKNPNPIKFSKLKNAEELKNNQDDLDEIYRLLEPELIVPMKSKNSLNGIILLGKKISGDEFELSEKEFLKDLGKFAAIAVENSRLYLMATLDRMTRLYIHHYFQERLQEEIKRSIRNDTPISLIMSDIDHFKKFNDTYGHQQGDVVLKETAKIFKQITRSADVPARYGGEEFAIILPETSIEEAMAIAERLRSAIEKYEYSGQTDPLHVTMSLGVAQYNADHDYEPKDLIKRADDALYIAKESGRNITIESKIE